MILKHVILTGVLSVILLTGTATVSLADENKTTQNSVAPQASSHSDSHHESTPNTPAMSNPPVTGTAKDTSPSSNTQHESTSGMDPNMPGMGGNNDHGSAGHGSTASDEGVNGYVVGGFSLLNLLIIASAGILKKKHKPST